MQKKHELTVFSLTMITVGSVDSIRNLPATALFGGQLISFFIFGALFFLLPTALASAELASGWPKGGGIYIWVREAFGKRMGFLAIWLQWAENIIWYPTLLSFVAGTIGYLIDPKLTDNPYFIGSIITVAFWSATLLNLRGMRSSSYFSNICAIFGLILPMILIISLGMMWVIKGNPIHIKLDYENIRPHWSDHSMWISLTAIIMSFCGIEIATVHANEVRNPQHAFPRALIYSVLIILSTLVAGSLAIAIVLPQKDINLIAGIMQAFEMFFKQYHLTYFMPLIAVMLIVGGLGNVSNWIIAPTKGLLIAANDGHLPKIFRKENQHGAPVTLLIVQAIIVTILSALFIFMPSINGSYWLLTALAAQLYMLMYFLMFAAVIKLRWSEPTRHRPFRIPGGIGGVCVLAGIGTLGGLITFIVSFIPPSTVNVGSLQSYETLLILGLMVMCMPPLVTPWIQKHYEKYKASSR